MFQDLRYGLRTLFRSPGFTAVAVAALALGIGANTAVFSLADVLLFRPLLIKDLDRLVILFGTVRGTSDNSDQISPADFLDFREQVQSIEHLAAWNGGNMNLTGAGEPERVMGMRVSAGFFEALAEKPLLGRTFSPEEDEPGRERVVILSHGLWERRFGADQKALGATVELDGRAHQVVGIMSRDFRYPPEADLWVPLAMGAQQRKARGAFYMTAVGRLKAGVSLRQANAEIDALGRRLAQQYPQTHSRRGARVALLREYTSGDLARDYTFLLLGAVGFVLLIACANVANLQFARVSARAREIAVRAALGAGRWRIVRQLLVESLLLALLGAVLGVLLAVWGIDLLRAGMPADVEIYLPGWQRLGLNGPVLACMLAIAVVGGIIAGVAPAWIGSRADLHETLKESGRGAGSGSRRHRVRSLLVVSEVVLAMVLLAGAGLVGKGFRAISEPAPKLDAQKVLTLRMLLPQSKYAQNHQIASFQQQVLHRLQGALPAESVGLIRYVPYSDSSWTANFTIEGRPAPAPAQAPSALMQTASEDYFRALRIPLREGRFFSERDGEEAPPAVIISENLARRYFPGESPVGRRLKIGLADANSPWLTVVGVVGDIRHSCYDRTPARTIYQPYRQVPVRLFSLVIRTSGDPKALVPAVRAEIAAVDRNQPLFAVKTLEKVINDQLVGLRYVASLMGVFGGLALLLATIGVYSVMAYAVIERTHEVGVRLALGAQQRDVVWLMVKHGLILGAAGSAAGLLLAAGLAQALSSLIFGVGAFDFGAFAGVLAVLAAATVAASYLPARRASRTDPLVALRYE